MIIIVFGLAGSGKSYVANWLSTKLGFFFYEGDDSLTDEMKQAIQAKQVFTQAMRDTFTFELIIKLKSLESIHNNVVTSQALYKEQNRAMLKDAFPNAKFIQVTAEPDVLIRRVKDRFVGIDRDYVQTIQANFEEAVIQHAKLINNVDGEEALITQLKDDLDLGWALNIHDPSKATHAVSCTSPTIPYGLFWKNPSALITDEIMFTQEPKPPEHLYQLQQ